MKNNKKEEEKDKVQATTSKGSQIDKDSTITAIKDLSDEDLKRLYDENPTIVAQIQEINYELNEEEREEQKEKEGKEGGKKVKEKQDEQEEQEETAQREERETTTTKTTTTTTTTQAANFLSSARGLRMLIDRGMAKLEAQFKRIKSKFTKEKVQLFMEILMEMAPSILFLQNGGTSSSSSSQPGGASISTDNNNSQLTLFLLLGGLSKVSNMETLREIPSIAQLLAVLGLAIKAAHFFYYSEDKQALRDKIKQLLS